MKSANSIMKNRLVKTFRKNGNEVTETTKFVGTPKVTFNTNTKEGAYNQYQHDGDLDAYVKHLSDINQRGKATEPKVTPKNNRFTFTNAQDIEQATDSNLFVRPEVSQFTANDFKVVNTSTNPVENISKVAPVYLVQQGYYLLFDNGKVFILSNKKNSQKSVRGNQIKCIPDVLVKSNTPECNGLKRYSGNMVIVNDIVGSYSNLNRQEFDKIVSSKPSYEDLLSVYFLFENKEELEMNVNISTPVW